MKTRNRILKAAAFILTAVIVISIFPVSAAAETVGAPKNLITSLTGNSAEMAVTWWNDESETAGEVRYSVESTLVHCSTAAAVRVYVGGGYSVFEGTMTGLAPDTTYYYQVENNAEVSPVKHFKTSESNPQSYSFLYLGDVQLSETGTQNVTDNYATWGKLVKAAKQRNPDLLFGLQGGDLVENGTSMEEWNALLENAGPVFSEIPFMPANGNHESNFLSGKPELYLNFFDLPKNGPEEFKEEFYSFDYGSSHIVVLNSWVFSGEQKLTAKDYDAIRTWIAKDLESSKATWKIVVTHVPAYAVFSDVNADAVKKNWAPIFEQYGVDLVLVGHQHVYSRSYPMYQGSIDYEKGVTYIMGDSGQKFYSSADERYSEKTIYNTSTYQVVHIDGNTMEVLTYDAGGNELDYWSASAKDRGETLTRAMFAAMLYRMAGEPQETFSGEFNDVPSGAWYGAAAAWASEKGIINGYGNGRFGPEDTITREQLAAMLYRYASSMDYDTAGQNDLSGFHDTAKIGAWSVPALRWAVGAGLISGRETGALDPAGAATRAECTEILMKFENLANKK